MSPITLTIRAVEKKRTAIDQLSGIEKHLRTFRSRQVSAGRAVGTIANRFCDRLYEERIAQLELEEAQLKQDTPTHPEYLAMVHCIDERRDEKIRIAERLKEYSLQTAQNFGVSRRSQILGQYAQTVRDTRESKLEALGKQWYDIQNDRRHSSGSVPDYAYKYSEKRSQNISNQMSYNKEVSILSGVAKYVGFPAAPPMSAATGGEIEDDLERMGVCFPRIASQIYRLTFGFADSHTATTAADSSTIPGVQSLEGRRVGKIQAC